MSSDSFDRDSSLVRSLVRQHRLSDYVARWRNGGIRSLQLLVHFDKAAASSHALEYFSSPGISEFGFSTYQRQAHDQKFFFPIFSCKALPSKVARNAGPSSFSDATVVFSSIASKSSPGFCATAEPGRDLHREASLATSQTASDGAFESGITEAELQPDVSTPPREDCRNVFEIQGGGGKSTCVANRV